MSTIHVLKFGGTSLQNHNFIRQAAQITSERMHVAHPVVVVSAIGGVTNQLIKLADDIADDPGLAERQIQLLKSLHLDLFDRLIGMPHYRRETITSIFSGLRDTVFNYGLRRQNRAAWKEQILATGERASAALFSATLNHAGLSANAIDATRFILTDSNFGRADVRMAETREAIKNELKRLEYIPVVTGFIGSDRQGNVTTLGRSGSDLTAGLIADALEAEKLEIWTDVNGVLTADPKWVSTAKNIGRLSFDDISELAAHGAGMIHPDTIAPISGGKTTVAIKNSYNPSHPGTLLHKNFYTNGSFENITITGPFTCFRIPDSIASSLAEYLGEKLEGETGSELFSCRRYSKYEPALFTVKEELFARFRDSIQNWLNEHSVECPFRGNVYRLKKFSNRFKEGEQLTGQILGMLAEKQLRPLSIQRHPEDRYLGLLLDKKEAFISARLINDYLENDRKRVDLFIAGTGAVGGTLLKQLHVLQNEQRNVHFHLLGACNSRFMAWKEDGFDINGIPFLNSEICRQTDWDFITQKLTEPVRHRLIFVDATGSSEVARLYPKLFDAGIHVATPSKLSNTFEQSFYDYLHHLAREHNLQFRYETAVGAGLPVLSTIEGLLNSGDRIVEISGVVSGTMTYLFNRLEEGVLFSNAVAEAREKDYAEPDPRDDLSGEDVARKFLILARKSGFYLNREDLEVESLLPPHLADLDRDTFLERLNEIDDYWKQNIEQSRKRDETLRYTGVLSADGSVRVGVQAVPTNSPLGRLNGSDNLIQIRTKRYKQSPIIIQGPGAGSEVTAAGLLADMLNIAERV